MQAMTKRQLLAYFNQLLLPDRGFYSLAVVYTVAISLLTLAVPISVQTLISTVANTALLQPVIVLGVLLLTLLLLSGLMTGLRTYVMELFRRRIYARLTSEIVLRSINSEHTYFDEHNRQSLFNRYFDIMTLQKTIPTLLVGGFSLFLQALVGFTVVSLYHPVFLMFTLGFLIVLYLIWRIWGPRAIDTGIELSHAKYQTAEWLETLAENNGFFRSRRHVNYALKKTEQNTTNYIDAHKRHFRKAFAQTIALLVLYAVASSVLLGLGGWLVIIGELTLGQLVAAELIMTAIFFGVSQAGAYLDTFYDLCAGIEELSMFLRIPLENVSGTQPITTQRHTIVFRNVAKQLRQGQVKLDLELPHGAKILARAERLGLQKFFTNCLKRHVLPDSGQILLGEQDLLEIDAMELREAVTILDRPSIIDCRVSDYLQLANPAVSRREQREMLTLMGVDQVIDELDEGWNTMLNSSGSPLSRTETMRLRLAAALLSKPRLLVMTQIFDVLDNDTVERLMHYLHNQTELTLVAFTRHTQVDGWTHNLELGFAQQVLEAIPIPAQQRKPGEESEHA